MWFRVEGERSPKALTVEDFTMNLILQLVALNRECSFSFQFCECKRGNDLCSVQDAGLL